MESKLETALNLAERIINQLGNRVPPEVLAIEELKKLIPQIRQEHAFASPLAKLIAPKSKKARDVPGF